MKKLFLIFVLFITIKSNAQYVHANPDTATVAITDSVNITACLCSVNVSTFNWIAPARVIISNPNSLNTWAKFTKTGTFSLIFQAKDLNGTIFADTIQLKANAVNLNYTFTITDNNGKSTTYPFVVPVNSIPAALPKKVNIYDANGNIIATINL